MTEVPPLDTFDQASLEGFTSELVAAGFEPDPDTELRCWTGPAHPALAPLTDAQQMRLVIRDGWPETFPYIFAEGIHANHLTATGYVCLWHEGESSQQWATLEGLFSRLVEWCDAARNGWDPDGLALDAQLNFQPKASVVAAFDLNTLQIGGAGTWGTFHGKPEPIGRVALHPGGPHKQSELRGLWFCVSDPDIPPRNLEELLQVLTRKQARGLTQALASRRHGDPLQPRGSVDLILLLWHRDGIPHPLVLALEGTGDNTLAIALYAGPSDNESLMLRAGPDAALLTGKTVAILGLGALGGHVAVALAESGITQLRLFDGDTLLPENVVRHTAGHLLVGAAKPDAVAAVIADHAPWTKVSSTADSPMTPSKLGLAIAGSDLVVDTTGGGAATRAICLTAQNSSTPLVSGALYRGGAIARIRRQGTSGDTPILERASDPDYMLIPPGEDDHLTQPAIGCSGPIHNAPPTAVLAAAALISQMAIDVLTERLELPDELIDVYRPLPNEPPFERIGRLTPAALAIATCSDFSGPTSFSSDGNARSDES